MEGQGIRRGNGKTNWRRGKQSVKKKKRHFWPSPRRKPLFFFFHTLFHVWLLYAFYYCFCAYNITVAALFVGHCLLITAVYRIYLILMFSCSLL